ncbi:Cullin [Radiomyces spectabilis]|uniref:Cullin n=1 Tax=Radiomyces spectabilis TaxID=64574 RepID=UPI0022209740|nr:Cullin [Radiomyces spectabilis]KAI8388291.1 Cullin [Radiomyces spectabilis]
MTTAAAGSRPFSERLSNSSRHTKRHPILSDKKLIVYDLKVERPALPADYEEKTWIRLQHAVHAMLQQEPVDDSLEALYQLCENLCQYDLAENLYQRLHHEIKVHVKANFEKLSEVNAENIAYLEIINTQWTTYCAQMSQIRGIFLYLDRTFVASATSAGSLWNMAMDLFRESYLQHENIRQRLLQYVLDLILSERNGETVDTSLLQSILRMFIDLSVYHLEFEEPFLEQTRKFYCAEGDKLVKEMHMSGYLDHVSMRVHQESTIRVKRYFDKSSKVALTTIVEEELLSKRVEYILDKSFNYFMENHRMDDLSLLYRLLKKVGKLDICAKYFLNYVKTRGSQIMRETAKENDVITALATFKRKTDVLVMHSFEEDERFTLALKHGFEYFINLRENNASELLAEHTDRILRIDKLDYSLLEQGMLVFRYVSGKDAYGVLYKRDLAKRLLLDVANPRTEKLMIAKMKKECGPAYTSKLEGMLRDIKHSRDLMNEFKFREAEDLYKAFYSVKYTGRRLTWQNSLGVCQVAANYPQASNHCS